MTHVEKSLHVERDLIRCKASKCTSTYIELIGSSGAIIGATGFLHALCQLRHSSYMFVVPTSWP
jgi:hypothetical protein